jgi:hypothetical protein
MSFESQDNVFTGYCDVVLTVAIAWHHATGEEDISVSGPRNRVVSFDAVLIPDFTASFDSTSPEEPAVMQYPVPYVWFGVQGRVQWP